MYDRSFYVVYVIVCFCCYFLTNEAEVDRVMSCNLFFLFFSLLFFPSLLGRTTKTRKTQHFSEKKKKGKTIAKRGMCLWRLEGNSGNGCHKSRRNGVKSSDYRHNTVGIAELVVNGHSNTTKLNLYF